MEVSNNVLGKALYEIQRFQILQVKLNPATERLIPDHYAYAWFAGVYPILEEGIHESHKHFFETSVDKVDQVTRWADDEWINRRYHNFYEYEEHFNSRSTELSTIGRADLIHIFRYSFLKRGFDEKFWATLLEPMKHPTEATTITSPKLDLYLH